MLANPLGCTRDLAQVTAGKPKLLYRCSLFASDKSPKYLALDGGRQHWQIVWRIKQA